MVINWILRKHNWGNYRLRGKNGRYRKVLSSPYTATMIATGDNGVVIVEGVG